MPRSDAVASPALAVTDLTVRFGERTVLDRLCLTAERAVITAVLGPNGAGKTTLIRCCTGLLTRSGGDLQVLGRQVGDRELTARVGVMPQSTGAWSGVRPIELLGYLAGLYSRPLDVTALTTAFGIDAFASTPYRRLSGGQQQAVNLAGALIGRPELVFLDEPTAGMDPHARRATWAVLRQLRGSGVGVILTTHAMDEAAELADHIVILDAGRVAVSGTIAELTRDGASLEEVFLAHTTAGALS
ncbi:MAG: ABC transporter ATP-binding protein [Propionibacteriaceae bacterium]